MSLKQLDAAVRSHCDAAYKLYTTNKSSVYPLSRQKLNGPSLILALLSGTHLHHVVIRNAAIINTFTSAIKRSLFSLCQSD